MAKNKSDEGRTSFLRQNGWGAPILGVLVVLLLLVGISVSQAEPTSKSSEACAGEDCEDDRRWGWGHKRDGHRFFGHHGRHGRHGFGGRHDPERAKEHMEYATGWMLKRLDVEDDVQERIQARLDAAFDELLPLVEAHKGSRDVWSEAMLGAEKVDREALAAQRESTLAAASEGMRIVTDALADVADMLTPEQRAEIAEKIQRHHH